MTISDRLKKRFGSPGRGVVRALRNEIEHALSEHWTAKQIWEDLLIKGSIECSYRTFCRLLEKESLGKKTIDCAAIRFIQEISADKTINTNKNGEIEIKKFVFERCDGADLI